MILKKLSILNYKNILQAEVSFSPEINCFFVSSTLPERRAADRFLQSISLFKKSLKILFFTTFRTSEYYALKNSVEILTPVAVPLSNDFSQFS